LLLKSKKGKIVDSGIICIVTLHGIGFQQPPLDGVEGYADDLHTNLCSLLNQDDNVLLSDDPDRQTHQKGDSVPIYVQSTWPPTSLCRENGLKRLGSWDEHRQTVNHDDAPLVTENARIAHVALVYSGLEGEGPQVGATVIASGLTAVSAHHYSHITGLLDMLFLDIMQPLTESLWTNMLEHPPQHDSAQALPKPSLRIRQDEGYTHLKGFPKHPTGFIALLRQLENDVAAYVCHNERRQRVRSFVLDALLRLTLREDVAGIVLNTHSNGTIVGLDIIQELPPLAARKIRAFITAGSPIRKYVDLFDWGKHLATIPKVERWWNFWDAKDIVADPLLPSADCLRGNQPTSKQLVGIYQALDSNTGEVSPMLIKDILVDNMANSPAGGLQAHNYWDNTKEFIPQVAKLLRDIVEEDEVSYD
jgi:hypothetical protein